MGQPTETNKFEFDSFRKDLLPIMQKYGVENWVLGGSANGEFVGLLNFSDDNKPRQFGDFFEVVANAGRLWQAAREKSRGMLNSFERKW